MRQGWRLRTIMWGKKNFLLPLFYNISLLPTLGQMAFNVPAVYDVFAVAIKEREAFQQPQKCGEAKYHKGAKPRLVFCVARAAEGGEAYTDLLYEVLAGFYQLFFLSKHCTDSSFSIILYKIVNVFFFTVKMYCKARNT